MWKFLLGGFLAVVFSAQADACVVGGFRTQWGETAETTMSVDRGKGCAILMNTGGQSSFQRVYISKQPKHGVAEIRTANSPGYRSRPNFTGQDEFEATLCGSDRGRSGCSILRVRVTVN